MTPRGLELWGWVARRRALHAGFDKLQAEFARRFQGYIGEGLTGENRQRLYDEIWQSILVQRVPTNARIEIHESAPDRINVTITVPLGVVDEAASFLITDPLTDGPDARIVSGV